LGERKVEKIVKDRAKISFSEISPQQNCYNLDITKYQEAGEWSEGRHV
jgi:hypothetical protein